MKIVFAAPVEMKSEKWLAAIEDKLPDCQLYTLDNSPGDADYAVVWNPPALLFQREPKLKYLFNLGAGVDALVKSPDLPENLPVVRLEDGGMAAQMAEYVIHFLTQQSRNFPAYAKEQKQSNWHKYPSIKRQTWKIGIMGAGIIGTKIAQICAALEYPTSIWSRSAKNISGVKSFAGHDQFQQFLAETRVIINVLPLTDTTKGILCTATFKQLQPDAMLINIARGNHLVESDLLDCLADGTLKKAVLDVFQVEPLPKDHPFWQHENIIITPHISGQSLLRETVEQIANKIKMLENGEAISGIINRNSQY